MFDAIAQHRKALESGPEDQPAYPDLRTPEWEVFSAPVSPEATDDFTLRRDPQGVPAALAGFLADVAQAERLREVRALTGFTRLDAPDPEGPDLVTRAPLARDRPIWVSASEVRRARRRGHPGRPGVASRARATDPHHEAGPA